MYRKIIINNFIYAVLLSCPLQYAQPSVCRWIPAAKKMPCPDAAQPSALLSPRDRLSAPPARRQSPVNHVCLRP
ncbi:hypothetical protein GGI42DRAFT_315572 [Trichoderma sp. SZMC 28013]